MSHEKRSFSRLIIGIARVAIALSLAVMIVASSMVSGFRETISEKIYGFWGHVNISKQSLRSSYDDLPMPLDTAFMDWAQQQPNIANVQVYARKAGIIKTRGNLEGMILKGISTDFYWKSFSQYLIAGQPIQFNKEGASGDMLLSKSMATRLNLQVGDSAILHFIDQTEDGNFSQRYRKLKVSGIYNTGLEEFDKLFVLADIKHIQRLNNWGPNEVGGYEIFADSPDQIEVVYEAVNYESDPFWSVQTVYELIPGIFDWLNLQKVNERIILILMFVVAVINMITSLLILILERTNMIGTLKAMGAGNGSIQSIFLINAAHIICWGMLMGDALGLGICYLQQTFGIIRLPEESYYVSVAPVSIHYLDILFMNLATIVISLLFLILPSRLVARIHPVKAIRFS
jgi:lipoprotein-releasing system permease protein